MSTNVLHAVIELRRALSHAAASVFAVGVSAKQATILREIRVSGPVSQIALARSTATDPGHLVRLLDDLKKKGLVQRERSDEDRRQMVVSLTPKGRGALGPINRSLRKLARVTEQDLTTEERDVFIALAAKIVRSLSGDAQGLGGRESR